MQAARGASLNSSDPDHLPRRRPGRPPRTTPSDADGRAAQRPSRRRCLLVLALVAALGYGLDLLTKTLAVAHLSDGSRRRLVGVLLTLELVRNPGAAFSTATGHTWLLSLLAIAAACAVLWVARRLGSVLWAVALGFLMAGFLGNLTDRVFRSPGFLRGHVVDFLRLPHWPIFNVADMCINVAAVLIVLLALRGIALGGTRGTAAPDAARDAAADAGEPTP
jgi:signal peptidase II